MLEELRSEVWQANLELQRSGLVLLTWGNVSGYHPETGLVAIKPSGVSYEELRPEQMVIVDLEGKRVEGDLRPSSDTATHLELYRSFPGLGGVAHTHSTYTTAWAQARRPLPCYGTTHADTFRGEVPLSGELTPAQLAGDYELETGRAIVRACAGRDPQEMPAALVVSHGPFTWGRSAGEAVENSVILEQCARLALLTERLEPQTPPLGPGLQDKHFLRKHGAGAYYGQSREE